jgi:hypothetical protein
MWFRKRRDERPVDEDKVEREWRRDIAKYGWLVIDVHEDDQEGPGFHFTVGLKEKNLPESSTTCRARRAVCCSTT